MAHVFIAGLGQLGSALAETLMLDGHAVSAGRRGNQAPAGVDLYSQDFAEGRILLPPDQIDLLYIILSPASRAEEEYQRAFLAAPIRLLDALAEHQPLPPVVFVSSTAVYGERLGEADEETRPEPARFNGRILLAAEEEIAARTVATAVRFSGIYGPGRERLIKQVAAIAAGDSPPQARFSNRIHSADCVGLLAQVGRQWLAGEMQPPVVLGTDRTPVINREVLNFIGEQTGQPLALDVPDIAPGKRLHSRYIDAGHYALRYPDYRAGYGEMLG